MINEIYNTIIDAITDAHHKAELSVSSARVGMVDAINDKIVCAALVEKAKQIFRHDLKEALSSVMNPEQVTAYLSLHDAAQKRPAMYDKRQLLLIGILESGDPPIRTGIKQRPDLITYTRRYIGNIEKQMSQIPLTEWTTSERLQAKDIIKPVVDFYNSL